MNNKSQHNYSIKNLSCFGSYDGDYSRCLRCHNPECIKETEKRTKEENESTYTISEVCDRKGTKTMTLGEAVMIAENYIDGIFETMDARVKKNELKRTVNISPREAEALGMVIAAARQKQGRNGE